MNRGKLYEERYIACRQGLNRAQTTQTSNLSTNSARLLPAVCAYVVLVAVLAVSGLVSAAERTDEIPENATIARYGGGWDCDRGYRETNGSCTAVTLPANAYATNSIVGNGWECIRGHKEQGDSCVAIEVPANGYLNAGRGDAWKCARGFRKTGNSCARIIVPTNAYLSTWSYGPGWECERGYRVVDESCFAFTVPDNAHVNYSGNDWDCNRPYRKSHDTCKLR